MSTDEHQILEYLKNSKEFFSVREVSRRIGGKKRCQKEPTWAKPCLVRLANGGHLMMNEIGHFRYQAQEKDKKKAREKLHVAPHLAKILADGGKVHLLSGDSEIIEN